MVKKTYYEQNILRFSAASFYFSIIKGGMIETLVSTNVLLNKITFNKIKLTRKLNFLWLM